MAGLAQQHEAHWVQVGIVSDVLVMYVQITGSAILLATEVASVVVRGQHIFSEDGPSRSAPKCLVFLFESVKIFFSVHTD